MGQLDGLVVGAVNAIPDEAEDVLARALRVAVDLSDGRLALNALLVTRVDQRGELVQLVAPQKSYIHQIDERAAVFQLLLRLV